MKGTLSENIWDVLACPYCGNPVSKTDNGARCRVCQQEYTYNRRGQLDLRLRKRKLYHLPFELGEKLQPPEGVVLKALRRNASPQVDFSTVKVPWYLKDELLSYFPKADPAGSPMLDLGCGSTVHRRACEHAGFEYVGLDYDSPEATILGDGHALPFKDATFPFILSMAVLEHIRYPFVMTRETYRVLKPGGVFIGSVAFLEPFHGDSYYHHTHLGAFNSLHFAGFDIKAMAPVSGWSGLLALATLGLFPKVPRPVTKCLILPLHLLHRLWWQLGYLVTRSRTSSEEWRLLRTAGAFAFVAVKPERATQ
jgi:SAM-dependent methyltransferase